MTSQSHVTHGRTARVLLGVTGGIAAYKSAELVRRLRDHGLQVQVVMTAGAQAFITPLTLHSLSGMAVRRDLLDEAAEAAMGHIELARWADVVLVAPASANFIARLAHGMADDLLTTVCLASAAPIRIAPAMNQQMWAAAATQDNIATVARRGVDVLGPASGEQACGDVGAGRMLEPGTLADFVADGLLTAGATALGSSAALLDGARVLVTAGPTREPLDPVRYLTNRSSGRMGFAVAAAARAAGASVTLVSGPCSLPTPASVQRIDVESAQQMHAAVTQHAATADIFIAAAAVADYRPAQRETHKIKKTGDKTTMLLELERNADILASVASSPARPFCVGFAAETREVERYARAKLERKALDMIAANQVGVAHQGFDVNDNSLEVYWPGGGSQIPLASKQQVAQQLIELIAERWCASDPTSTA